MSISMKRYNNTIITPKDDRILFDQIFDDYGLIYGGTAIMSAANKIHVGSARGFIKGTEVIIEDEDIAVELSDSGTKNGRLKIVMDLADTEAPVKFVSEVASTLPDLRQDKNINYDNGYYEVAFATYKATETTISDVTFVMPTMKSVKEKIRELNEGSVRFSTFEGTVDTWGSIGIAYPSDAHMLIGAYSSDYLLVPETHNPSVKFDSFRCFGRLQVQQLAIAPNGTKIKGWFYYI